jgi:hypothetical protein
MLTSFALKVLLYLWLASGIQAYMMPGMSMGMGMPVGGGMSPYGMNGYGGYRVYRKRRHRNLFQRITGTGRRYKYYMRPGMPGMMPGMGMGMPMGGIAGMSSSMMIGSPGMISSGGMMTPGAYGTTKNMMSSSTLSQACRARDTLTLRHVNCPYMNSFDVHKCINGANDPFVTALVRKCKGFFTKNPYQLSAYGMELILSNKPMAFGYLVTRSTCSMLGSYELGLLIKTAVLAKTVNTFSFVDYILNTCHVPVGQLAWLQTKALMVGDLSTATRLQRAATFPSYRTWHQTPNIVYLPSGRSISLRNNAALTTFNGRDMSAFGRIGSVCAYLRAEQLTHPMFPIELLSEMNENCFRHLRPKVFFYFTADMIKRFRWWRSATPKQIRFILPGPPIQSVPMYLLGMHNYINKLDRKHPCAGISKVQRMSIQMNPKLVRAFYDRCRAAVSAGETAKIGMAGLISALVRVALII